jgi:membrane fusion protein (multidrug efflux system)
VVLALKADNTQMVKAGQPLIELDPAAADIALAAAEAELARAVRSFRSASSEVSGGDAGVIQAEAELARARDDLGRREKAAAEGAVSGEDLNHARDAVKVAQANLELARSQRVQAESTVQGTNVMTNPAVLAAIARYRQAALFRAHMHIISPVDGVVAQRTAQIGQQVAAGTPLMAVVPLHRVWVDANFRETQLKDIRIGQPATVTTDAYGGKTVFHGKVAGINAGSGNAFALLPPQNASGNWIKIVQRVPVRIELDPKEVDKTPLRIGLSVSAEVETSDRSGALVGGPARQIYAEHQGDGDDPRVKARIGQIIAANRDQDR